jgi:cytochrome c553
MPNHIVRLILVMVAFGVAAYAAKVYFTPDSFYEYGHFRGDSVVEIASEKPLYKGPEYCQACHSERHAEWSGGAHNRADAGKVVQCESCHGAAGGRDKRGEFEYASTGVDHPASGKLPVPSDSVKLCTTCHEKMPGRPAEQPQIVVETHAGGQQCKTCHNPHSPKMVLAAVSTNAPAGNAAAGKAKAASCAACHGADGVSGNPAWPSLAAQRAGYLVDALKAYQMGARDEPMMAGVVKGMSDADLKNISAYYSGLSCRNAAAGVSKQEAAAGQPKAAQCAACHGAAGISPNPAWPSLAGQPRDYLVAAMKAYKSGARKHPMMAGIAKAMSDEDARDISSYYAFASCK